MTSQTLGTDQPCSLQNYIENYSLEEFDFVGISEYEFSDNTFVHPLLAKNE